MPDSLPHGERMEQLSPAQALDRTLAVTFFRSHGAAEQFRRSISLRAMVPHLRDHRGPDKASLPWLKLALFGDVATIRGSLRHDANVTQIDGIEADYDGEDITPDRARRIVERANIAAVIYTSPSHTAERPRWRILCPTSEPLAPADRARLVARVNGLFCGALAGESFTLSQSYYFGALHGATAHEVIALDGRAIDLCCELDEDAIGRHPAKPAPAAPQPAPASRYDGAGLRFAVVALERECDAIRAAPEGQKHTALNKAAYSIGGLVGGGHLPEHEAYGALAGALADIRARCADYAHAERTLRRAFDDGKGAPRAAPEPLATTTPAASHHPFGIGDSSPAAYDAETGEIIAPVLFPATPFAASDLTALRPREWVYGHYLIARFLSVLGAPGGTGKTAYAMVVGLSIATNRPLLGETVHKAGPVWIYNLEDPRDEVLRRVQAACIEHSINPADLEGRLFLDSGRDRPLVVAERTREGTIIALPVVEPLIEELKARQVRLLIVDPFVKSHRLEENRNEQVDFAATLWNRVADAAGCAILLVHHFRKGAEAGSADAFRGASALIDASRAAVSLATMSEKDAERCGIEPEERRFYVRADNAKLNLAPPPKDAVWLQLKSVDLPNGDRVQAVRRWEPPSPWEGVGRRLLLEILHVLAKGQPNGDLWMKDKRSDGWAGKAITENSGLTPTAAFDLLRDWEKGGLIHAEEFVNHHRKNKTGYRVNEAEFSKLRLDWAASDG